MKHLVLFTLALLCCPRLLLASPDSPELSKSDENFPLQIKGDLTMDFSYTSSAGQEQNAFEIRRSEFGVEHVGAHKIGGEVLVEAIRSAGPDSFSGIDGDSLLIRLKRAWGYARQDVGPLVVEGRAGLVENPWIEGVEEDSELRYVEKLTAERLGIYFSSDLGAIAKLSVLDGRLKVQGGLFNGEGANQLEQNNGKNAQFLISGTLWSRAIAGDDLRLRLRVGGQEGSLGPSAAANHRLSAGLSAVHPRLAAGVEVHRAFGDQAVSSRESESLGGWLRARHESFSLVLRYDHQREDLMRPRTSSQFVLAGIFAEQEMEVSLIRMGLVARYEDADDNASPVPGLASAGSVKAALLVFSASFGRQ